MKLRDYQIAAIDSASRALGSHSRVVIVASTGSGKSLIIAGMCDRAIEKSSEMRVLVLCHTQEILKQNEEKLNLLAPNVTTGIYCAGVGRKDKTQQVIFASRDSLGRTPLACGEFSLVICDECHTVAVDVEDGATMYGKIFQALVPRWVVGLTATPFRMAGGNIWGEGKFFEKVAYNIGIGELIKRGFLSPYVFPPCETKIETTGMKVQSTGDFKTSDLEAVAGGREICEAAVSEWMRRAATRKCSLFFAVSRKHGQLLTNVLRERLGEIPVAYIDGETKHRAELMQDIRAGKYRAVVNIGTLTTGADMPLVDCVVLVRPTASASLFVQMCGRGLRLSPGKSDCLILDFAGNFDRFGSIETPKIKFQDVREAAADPEGDLQEMGERPSKECPSCGFGGLSLRATFCPFCGEVFVKRLQRAFSGKKEPTMLSIMMHDVQDYVSKAGNFCKRVRYYTNMGIYSEYFAINRSPYAFRKYQERMSILAQKPTHMLAAIDGGLVEILEMGRRDA